MIEFINQNTFRILEFFLIYAFCVIIVGYLQEYRLRHRSKITYKKFMKLKKLFQLKIKKIYLFFMVLFILSSIYYSFIIIKDHVDNIFVLVIGLLNVLIFIMIWLHITSLNYNKDISTFSNYYQIIQDNFNNEGLLVEHIKKLEKQNALLLNECDLMNNEFSKFISNFNGIDHLQDTLLPFNNVIRLYQEQSDNFDFDIINKFNEALKAFLVGLPYDLTIEEYKFIDTVKLQNILDSIAEDQKNCILQFSFNKIKEKQIVSLDQLLNMIKKLKTLKISFSDEYTIDILNYSNEQINNKDKLLAFLADEKLISVDILCNYVHVHDLSWVYNVPLSKWIQSSDGLSVFTSIINHNASKCAYKILTSNSNQFNASIKKAVVEDQLDNETKNMFVIFSNILTMDDNFNSTSTKYENMAVVLNVFFGEYDQYNTGAANINNIIQNQTFQENALFIEETYENVKAKYKDLFLSIINTLFIYHDSSCVNVEYIDYDKVLKQYSEYRKNLNINELKTLDLLLKTLILMTEEDVLQVNEVFQMLNQSNTNITDKLSQKELRYDNRRIVGRTNIHYLTTPSNIKTLKRVLNRIENGRLVLDRIVNL